jgi:uncharacterized protein (DUF2141 family)
MVKKLLLFLMIFALMSSVASAKDTFSIFGEVSFQYEGDIYVCLCDADEWSTFQTHDHRLLQKGCQVTRWGDEVKKAGKISFSFANVPKGTYSIIAYQDVNNNGKVDYENYVIVEPWQCFRERGPVMEFSSWEQVRFDLKEDMKGIEIHM